MIVIRSKPQYENCSCQSAKDDKAFSVDRLSDLTAGEATSLNSSAQLKSNRTGVATDQVPGSDATSDVAGFGKVLPVLSSGSSGRMATWSYSGERDESSLGRNDFQSPLGVDSLNDPQRDFDPHNQIIENQLSIGDLDARSPKQEVGQVPNPARHHEGPAQIEWASALNAHTQSEQKDSSKHDAKVFSESGLILHIDKTLGGK